MLLEITTGLFECCLGALVLGPQSSKFLTACLKLLASGCKGWANILEFILETLASAGLLVVSDMILLYDS